MPELVIADSIWTRRLAKMRTKPFRAAIAASADGAARPGQTLERVTVFGQVHGRSWKLASEVIFVTPSKADGARRAVCVSATSRWFADPAAVIGWPAGPGRRFARED